MFSSSKVQVHNRRLYLIASVSCQKGPTRHAYAWQIGPFWQDTLDRCEFLVNCSRRYTYRHVWNKYKALRDTEVKKKWKGNTFRKCNEKMPYYTITYSCQFSKRWLAFSQFVLHFRLTHWGRVTHICVGKQTNIGSDNGLTPGRRQAIIWTNAGILSIGPLGTNSSEFLIVIHTC